MDDGYDFMRSFLLLRPMAILMGWDIERMDGIGIEGVDMKGLRIWVGAVGI